MGTSATIPPVVQKIERKTKFNGKIIKTILTGAIIDIGLEKPGVAHISQLSNESIKRVEDVVKVGDEKEVWVHRINKKTGIVELSLIEPLGLEWSEIKKGQVVPGTVVRIEKFGAFIEIGAERPGLAHISELTYDFIREVDEAVKVGQEVEVMVLGVDRRKKQIKLSLKAAQEDPTKMVIDDEEDDDLPVPTAMEMALRKAMTDETSVGIASEEGENGEDHKKQEMEDILTRTLKNKVRTE